MSAPSTLCLSATINTRTWIARKRHEGVEPDVAAHLQKNYPTLKPKEVDYVLRNVDPGQRSAPEHMAFW